MLIALLLYLSLSLLLMSCTPWKVNKFNIIIFISLPIFSLICLLAFYIINEFSGQGIDERVIFHIRMGLVGIDISDYFHIIVIVVLLLIMALLFSYKLVKLKYYNCVISKTTYCLVFIVLYCNPVVLAFFQLYGTQYIDRLHPEDITQYYVRLEAPTDNIELNKKYIIILYLESLEKSFYDDSLFPELMPYLKDITQNNITFTNVKQVAGTGFTIGGIVSSQCGVPLISADQTGRLYQGVWNNFLGDQYCLGDFFKDSNYINYFVGGADSLFAGKKSFFLSHSFLKENIIGAEELTEKFKNQGVSSDYYRSQWGFYDEVILDEILDIYKNSSDNQQYIVGLTLGTHHPGNLISDYCAKNFTKYDSVYLNILSCTDDNLRNFISEIKSHSKADETLLILASDHLAMNNEFLDNLLMLPNRTNLLTMIDFANPQAKNIVKNGSTLDSGATILDYLTFDKRQVGLGRSLLSAQDTLVEKLKEKTDRTLRSWVQNFSNTASDVNLYSDSLSFSSNMHKLGNLTSNVFPFLIIYNSHTGKLVSGLGGFDKHPILGNYIDYYEIKLLYENLQQDQNNLLLLSKCTDVQNIFVERIKVLSQVGVNGSFCYVHIQNSNNKIFEIQIGGINGEFNGNLDSLLLNSSKKFEIDKYEFLFKLKNLLDNLHLFL